MKLFYLLLLLYLSYLFYIFNILQDFRVTSQMNVSLYNILVIKEDPLVEVTNATPVAVGGSLSACVILFIVVAVLVLR